MNKNNDLGLLVLRVSLGLLMLLHGIAKLVHGLDFIKGMLSGMGLPSFFAYGVLVGEVLAPIALIAGFRTRIAAAIYAVNCIVAIAMAHSGDIFSLSDHGGWAIELLGLYLFGAVAIFFTGAGKYAVSNQNNWD
ncbi:DoxX family protein [Carboxylicivirga linearis]|uniref:DoxX family protein n=1 Tax=Carboxylicivirga linearis TaxID=1628157 RepID=A0ABS5JRM6_9BACT|nr:DoxX family protein [Carboxylicivirga linearis]MBS2097551.1 DoxX family protein [Carboxylicivirga linearis]